MRPGTTILLLIVLSLISQPMMMVDAGPDGRTEEDVRSNVPITTKGYPQQDGGDDDRYFEYRSMWCDGYDIVNISMVKKLVAFARDHNFNCLSPNINGNYNGIYYNSSYSPKHKDVHWSFDPLMELIKEAHKYGIQVHPWFHTFLDYHATTRNPSWRVVSSTGVPTSWMNPALPQVRDYLVNVTTELVRNYPLDGLKLDTVRYPGSSYSYDAYSLQKFESSQMTSFSDFRRLQVTECVGLIYDGIMGIRPYMWVGADIWMSYSSWYDGVFQDSREWARRGKLDYVTTMSYTTSRSSFEYYNKDIIANSQGIPVVCGPYVFVPGNIAHGSVPNETVGIDLLINQTETARRIGAMGTCMFAYKFFVQYPSYARELLEGPFSEKALCPLKEQRTPVKVSRWEFDRDHDREGWRVVDMGEQYPIDGIWSISNVSSPGLMSPLLNITAEGTNVIEISMISESKGGTLKVYWSLNSTVFDERYMVSTSMVDDGDWHLYSIHLDRSPLWAGNIRYLRIVTVHEERTSISLDLVRLYWMPDCIREWAYLGPFISGGDQDLVERDFLGGEDLLDPRLGDLDGGRTWGYFSMERDLVDLRFVLGGLEYSVVYAHIYIIAEQGGDHELRVGTSDGTKVFLNGEEVLRNTMPRRVSPDQNMTPVRLAKGVNRLLIKIAVYENELSFFARITRPGNVTSVGLTYLAELPVPPAPVPMMSFTGWTSSPTVPVRWDIPSTQFPIRSYEWWVDSGPVTESSKNSITIVCDIPGWHAFHVRSVDINGVRSPAAEHDFGYDPERPEITEPQCDSSIVGSSHIAWSWDLIRSPESGLKGYHVGVSFVTQDGDRGELFAQEMFLVEPVFLLDHGLVDTNSYIVRVRAESSNGLSSGTVASSPVMVDFQEPLPPDNLRMELIDGPKRAYDLSWEASWDNVQDGIAGYQVFKESENGTWLIGSTTELRFGVVRELGRNEGLKLRSMDRAGHFSSFSETVWPENIPPTPIMEVSSWAIEGYPVNFSAIPSFDQDGMIVEHWWELDGRERFKGPELTLTLESGLHWIDLNVVDDTGARSTLTLSLTVSSTVGPLLNGTFRAFIDSSSEMTVRLPGVNVTIFNNATVIDEPVEERPLMEGEKAFDILLIVLTIILPLIAVLSLALVTFDRMRTVGGVGMAVTGQAKEGTLAIDPMGLDVNQTALGYGSMPVFQKGLPVLNGVVRMREDNGAMNRNDVHVAQMESIEEMELEWEDEVPELETLEGLEELMELEEE